MTRLMDANNNNNIECREYCDCQGNTFCVCKEKECPVDLPELIPPLPFNFTLGHDKYYKVTIEKNVYKKRGEAFLHTKYPLRVGDIVKVGNDCTEYFIRKKLRKRDFYHNFVFTIERVDKVRMSYIDLNKLIKNKVLSVKGYFIDKTDN